MMSMRVQALFGTAATVFAAAFIGACGGGDDGSAPAAAVSSTLIRSATLNAAQETTGSTSTATGRGAVVVNTTTREITGGIVFSGMTASAAHIHEGAAGVAGGVIIPLTLSPDGTAATINAGTTLTAAQLTSLQAGNLYFNVHSTNNLLCGTPSAPTNCAGGEIRGQITGASNLLAGLATLNAAQETTGSTSTATGRGTIVVDSTTRDVLTCYATHGVANPTVAHIHTGAAGVAGPANVATLTAGTGVFTCPGTTPALTAQQVADITAGNTYFNIHSNNVLCSTGTPPVAAACTGGEIRGQIAIAQ